MMDLVENPINLDDLVMRASRSGTVEHKEIYLVQMTYPLVI